MRKRVAAVVMLFVMAVSSLAGCSKKTVSYRDNLDAYVKTMDYHDGFTILQLTDIHWSGASNVGSDDFGCRRYLKKVIREAEAHTGGIDLIEVTGDTFMLSNSAAVESFIEFMDGIGIPYAMIWGNHDRQSTYNPNWISRRFMEAPNCLYTEVENDDVHERSNYVINLIGPEGTAAWQITHLDSGASYRKNAFEFNLTYDYIRDDQLAWMSAEHDAVGKDVPVVCYYHIAQADYDNAWDAINSGAEGYKSGFFRTETFAASKYARSMGPVFLANNVKASFVGHAHADDWTVTTPDGIIYGLGVKSGYELYYGDIKAGYEGAGFEVTQDFKLSGASLVTLKDTSGGLKLEHLYLNERDEGDFVMWVEY